MCEDTSTFYSAHGEQVPHRQARSKKHCGKLMLLCAVARPRYDSSGKCTFYGKLGIWAFTKMVFAKRNPKNRKAGTIELKPLSFTRDVCKRELTKLVAPSIHDRWPDENSKKVFIRQDNAPAH